MDRDPRIPMVTIIWVLFYLSLPSLWSVSLWSLLISIDRLFAELNIVDKHTIISAYYNHRNEERMLRLLIKVLGLHGKRHQIKELKELEQINLVEGD